MPRGKVHKITIFRQKSIVKRYCEGASVQELSDKFKVSKGAVRYWIKKYDNRRTARKFVPAKEFNDLVSHNKKVEAVSDIRISFISSLNASLKDKYVFMDDFYDHHIYGNDEDSPEYSIRQLCEAMGVDRITYKHHLEKRDSYREQEARVSRLKDLINESYHRSKGLYSADQIKVDLANRGIEISTHYIRDLMREMNIGRARMTKGLKQKLFYYPETKCNLLLKGFKVTGINQLWVADFKEFGLHGHRYYICIILDAYSRRSLGAIIRETKGKYLAAATLRKALRNRGAAPKVFHTDGGGEFDAKNMRQMYKESGIRHSFSRPGTPTDNPFIESYFNYFQNKFLFAGEYFHSIEELKRNFDDFNAFYNNLIRSSLNYCSPVDYELKYPNETVYIHPGYTQERKATLRLSTKPTFESSADEINIYDAEPSLYTPENTDFSK